VTTFWLAGRASLTALNLTFAVQVLGRNINNGHLTITSAPLFRALAAQVKRAA
jgi:hypothetical protein